MTISSSIIAGDLCPYGHRLCYSPQCWLVKKYCLLDDCKNKSKSRGLCDKHYMRWLRHGTTELIKREKKIHFCSIDGCGKKVHAKGYCMKHYTRVKKYGDPFKVLPKGSRMKPINFDCRIQKTHANNIKSFGLDFYKRYLEGDLDEVFMDEPYARAGYIAHTKISYKSSGVDYYDQNQYEKLVVDEVKKYRRNKEVE